MKSTTTIRPHTHTRARPFIPGLLAGLTLAGTWACSSTNLAPPPANSDPVPTAGMSGAAAPEATATGTAIGKAARAYQSAMNDPLPAGLTARELESRMKEVDNRFYDLEGWLRSPQGEAASTELAQIVVLLRSARESRAEPGFHELADKALDAFGELARQIDAGNAPARLEAYDRVAGRCNACHKKYRKR